MQEIISLHKAFTHILYLDEGHRYIDLSTGVELISVTTLIKKYQQPFQKDFWLKKKAKEYGISPDELNESWNKSRIVGATRGTMLHLYFFNLWSGKEYPLIYPPEIQSLPTIDFISFHKSFDKLKVQANNFISDHPHLIPVKLEMVVGDSELGVAGQVDGLFYDEDVDGFALWDWKTDRKLEIHNEYQNFKVPISKLCQSEINKYSLQLSLYQHIIERNTNIKLSYRSICWFQGKNSSYEVFPVNYLEKEIEALFNGNTKT